MTETIPVNINVEPGQCGLHSCHSGWNRNRKINESIRDRINQFVERGHCYGRLSWCFRDKVNRQEEDSEEDASARNLSYVGLAAYTVLRKEHKRHQHSLWNITSAKVVGELQQTPVGSFPSQGDPEPGHDNWFPQKLCDLIKKAKAYVDVMSLGPPDGLFMEKFREAIFFLAKRPIAQDSPIAIRMMFGNIVGMPINCAKVVEKLTRDLPANHNLELWVGAWRKGLSWNHAKIIAVDGHYLWTGGHNFWDQHYLRNNPVHDLSMELEGRVTHNAHMFANEQWSLMEGIHRTCWSGFVNLVPDDLPFVTMSRVTVSQYPKGQTTIFPPQFDSSFVSRFQYQNDTNVLVPVICLGRLGRALPSDDALHAMMASARRIIRMPLQDLGPVCIPGTKITLPGCVWPKRTLNVLGRVIWEKGVDVEIILSNPGSIPGGLVAAEACYGNGWSCVDVAAEIIKAIQRQFTTAQDAALRQKICENLRVCFIRDKDGNSWKDGTTIGLHSKHIIIDDQTAYIGSQNLYICDLSEWGVVVDDKNAVEKMLAEYWRPMWQYSFTGEDCDVDRVMDGLKINRDAQSSGLSIMSPSEWKKQVEMARLQTPLVTAMEKMGSMYEDSSSDGEETEDTENS